MKYRYDQARAMLFDRTLPHMDGRAWAAFRKVTETQAEPPPKPLNEQLDISNLAAQLEETAQHLAQLEKTQQHLHLKNAELASNISNFFAPPVPGTSPLGPRRNLKAILNRARGFCCQKVSKRG